MKLPVKVTEPNVIKFALAIIADAKRAAINNFSFMLLVSLTCTNYAHVKVVGCFGDKNMCSSFAPLASPHKPQNLPTLPMTSRLGDAAL